MLFVSESVYGRFNSVQSDSIRTIWIVLLCRAQKYTLYIITVQLLNSVRLIDTVWSCICIETRAFLSLQKGIFSPLFGPGPFLTYKLGGGGANAPPVPPCAPPRNHFLPPQEKSLLLNLYKQTGKNNK